MIDHGGYNGFAGLLAIYTWVILGAGGSLILWAKYNHFRFRGLDRRRDAPVPTLADTAQWFAQSQDSLAHWRNASMLTVDHDPDGGIAHDPPGAGPDRRLVASPSPEAATSLP